MIEYQANSLDRVFQALADPTRRAMLADLRHRERSVGELASPHRISLAAASKHIKTLERAGLVKRTIRGRTHLCELEAAPLADVDGWLREYARFWNKRLDALEALLVAADAAAPSPKESAPMNTYGNLIADDVIHFERILPGPIERVWAYLVEPEKRRLWLADGPMALAPGGEVALRFRNAELSRDDDRAPERYRAQENSGEVHGRLLLCEPPHRLAFTWGDDPSRPDDAQSEVDIELSMQGERVRLVLTHRRLPAQELTSVAGGWHTHLGILEDHLSGQPPRPFWRTHTRLEAEYIERLDANSPLSQGRLAERERGMEVHGGAHDS